LSQVTNPFAVIEIGSKALRLGIFDNSPRGPHPRKTHAERCRLGEDLHEGAGTISNMLKMEAYEILEKFRHILHDKEIAEIYVVGTEAMRVARKTEDGKAFIGIIEKMLGRRMVVLDHEQEALLEGEGVLSKNFGVTGVLASMGGLTTQFSRLKNGKASEPSFVPEGVLSLLKKTDGSFDQVNEAMSEVLKNIDYGKVDNLLLRDKWRQVANLVSMRIHGKPQVALDWKTAKSHFFEIAQKDADFFRQSNVHRDMQEQADEFPLIAQTLYAVLYHIDPEKIVSVEGGIRDGVARVCRSSPLFRNLKLA